MQTGQFNRRRRRRFFLSSSSSSPNREKLNIQKVQRVALFIFSLYLVLLDDMKGPKQAPEKKGKDEKSPPPTETRPRNVQHTPHQVFHFDTEHIACYLDLSHRHGLFENRRAYLHTNGSYPFRVSGGEEERVSIVDLRGCTEALLNVVERNYMSSMQCPGAGELLKTEGYEMITRILIEQRRKLYSELRAGCNDTGFYHDPEDAPLVRSKLTRSGKRGVMRPQGCQYEHCPAQLLRVAIVAAHKSGVAKGRSYKNRYTADALEAVSRQGYSIGDFSFFRLVTRYIDMYDAGVVSEYSRLMTFPHGLYTAYTEVRPVIQKLSKERKDAMAKFELRTWASASKRRPSGGKLRRDRKRARDNDEDDEDEVSLILSSLSSSSFSDDEEDPSEAAIPMEIVEIACEVEEEDDDKEEEEDDDEDGNRNDESHAMKSSSGDDNDDQDIVSVPVRKRPSVCSGSSDETNLPRQLATVDPGLSAMLEHMLQIQRDMVAIIKAQYGPGPTLGAASPASSATRGKRKTDSTTGK